MDKFDEVFKKVNIIEQIIKYSFTNKNLLMQSFTHSSYSNEINKPSYERLEFLGDSILDMVVAKLLYFSEQIISEGTMTQLRSIVVSAKPLSLIFDKLQLAEFIITSDGSIKDEVIVSDNVKSDIIEAIIASIYLDGGLDKAEIFIKENINFKDIKKIKQVKDCKSAVLEYAIKNNVAIKWESFETGENLNKKITVVMLVNGIEVCQKTATRKKDAEKLCAQEYLEKEKINF